MKCACDESKRSGSKSGNGCSLLINKCPCLTTFNRSRKTFASTDLGFALRNSWRQVSNSRSKHNLRETLFTTMSKKWQQCRDFHTPGTTGLIHVAGALKCPWTSSGELSIRWVTVGGLVTKPPHRCHCQSSDES